jgi:hypothetical protein
MPLEMEMMTVHLLLDLMMSSLEMLMTTQTKGHLILS